MVATTRNSARTLHRPHILKDILDIKAFIHRITLTTDFKLEDLKTAYDGKMSFPKKNHPIGKSNGGTYDKTVRLTLHGGVQCTLAMFPDKGFKPKTIMYLSNPTSYIIRDIYDDAMKIAQHIKKERIGDFEWKISSIEYTFDFMCKNSTMVGDLYYILRRYAYFPYCKSTRMFGGKFFGYSESDEYHEEREDMNSVTQYLYTENEHKWSSKLAKIYERGDDKDNRGPLKWWSHNKCDRVRCEVTVRREILKRKGLNSLLDLLNNTQFENLFFPPPNHPAFMQFKQFIERKYGWTEKQKKHFTGSRLQRYTPPTDSDNFKADKGKEDNDRYVESFQEELFKARAEGYNTAGTTMHSPHFEGVKCLMKEAIREFDRKWLKALSG
jgi:hypothetical protein